MKRFFLRSVSIILSVAILFYGFVAFLLFCEPRAFDDHYQRGFIYQYRAIERETKPKIVTIGGSNVSFNVNSDLMSEMIGMPAYNLGVTASMGYTYVFETVEPLIGAGDKVIFPLWPFQVGDLDSNLIWITIESEPDLIAEYMTNHPEEIISTGGFALRKVHGLTIGKLGLMLKAIFGDAENNGYTSKSFDPNTGNMTFYREGPNDVYWSMIGSHMRFSNGSINKGMLEYVNAFGDRIRAKGAELYFCYPTVSREQLEMSNEEIVEYTNYTQSVFKGAFLTDLASVCYGHEEYYNFATHLSSHGMDRYTTEIANGLLAIK